MGDLKSSPRPNLSVSTDEETTVFAALPKYFPSPPNSPVPTTPFVFVVLDCVHYVAGERVTGEVLLNLPLELGPSLLVLESTGDEQICVYEGNANSSRKEAENQIYRLEQVIWESKDCTASGQLVFPFTFKLPQYCPATFSFQGEDESGRYMKGFINYSVTASLRIDGQTDNTISHSRPVLIHNALSHMKPSQSLQTDHIVHGCCCWSTRGRTKLKLSLRNEEHCAVSGSVKFKLDPDNTNCSAVIKSITGRLTHEIVFTLPGTRQFRHVRTLFSMTRATWISPSTGQIYDKDFEYLAELRATSAELNPSSNETPLIVSRYTIQSVVVYDVACRSESGSISLPLHVNPKNNLDRLEPKLPRKWDPHEHQIMNIMTEASRTSSDVATSRAMAGSLKVPN